MAAWLRLKGLWIIVSGKEKCPGEDKSEDRLAWLQRAGKAAGALYLAVESEQRVHLNGLEDDPLEIWAKLESVHLMKRPGARFNAYDDLFSIRKRSDESL